MPRRTRFPQFPAPAQVQDRAAARSLDAAKQILETMTGVRGDPLDRVLTYRDLHGTPIADISVVGGAPVIRSPQQSGPAATVLSNLEVHGAFENVILTWDGTNQVNYGYTEIWRNTEDNLGTAVLVGTAIPPVFADPVGPGFTGYYWVRAVNGQGQPGPFNAVAGTQGQTADDTTYIVDQLENALTAGQLDESLNSRIDLIDGDGPGSVNARIQTETDARIADVTQEATDRTTAVQAEVAARKAAVASLTGNLSDEVAAREAAISTLSTDLDNEVAARQQDAADLAASQVSVFRQQVEPAANSIGDIWYETNTADQVIAVHRWNGTQWASVDNVAISANAAAISDLDARTTTVEGATTANASDITALDTRLSGDEGNISGNADAISSLDTRVTTAEGAITSQASDITSLQSGIAAVQADADGNATAISGLDTRVTTNEGDITAHGGAITALENTVNDPDSGVAATASGLASLETTVSTHGDTIDSHSDAITALENRATADEGDITGNASAISGLDSRVTTNEGNITSASSDITTLQNNLATTNGNVADAQAAAQAASDLAGSKGKVIVSPTAPAAADELPQNLWLKEPTNTPMRWDGTAWQVATDQAAIDAANAAAAAQADADANASAISTLDNTVSQQGDTITSHGSAITNLENTVNDPATGVAANSSAISGLDSRVTTAEGNIDSHSSDITALQNRATTDEGNISANASALTSLDNRVTTNEGNIDSHGSAITSLQNDVSTNTGDISGNSSAISGLDSRVTTNEGAIDTHSQDITSLQNSVDTNTGDIAGNTSAVSSLDSRVTTNEGDITAQGSQITALEGTVNDPDTGVTATAQGLDALTIRVTDDEGQITQHADQLTHLALQQTTGANLIPNGQGQSGDNTNFSQFTRVPDPAAPGGAAFERTLQMGIATPVTGGAQSFRLVSSGNDVSVNAPASAGVYDAQGAQLGFASRSYSLSILDRNAFTWDSHQTYDIYGDGSNGKPGIAAMVSALNALGPDKIVVICTYDEPQKNRLSDGLDAAMYRCGASVEIFASDSFMYRSAYLLVGAPGIGQGNGIEAYAGNVSSDPNAWLDATFAVVNGALGLESITAGESYSIRYGSAFAAPDTPIAIDAARDYLAALALEWVQKDGETATAPNHTLTVLCQDNTGAETGTLTLESGTTTESYAQLQDAIASAQWPAGTTQVLPSVTITTADGSPATVRTAGWSLKQAVSQADLTQGLSADIDQISANLSAITSLQGDVQGNTGAISDIMTLAIDPASALATRFATLDTDVANNAADIVSEQTARSDADGAMANDITQLSTTVDGHTASIETNATSIDGLNAQYTIKTDVNGHIAGIGLASTTNDDGSVTASVIIQSDVFGVVQPDGSGDIVTPFTVGLVEGVSTVAIDGNLVIDGSLDIARATFGQLTADRIDAVDLSAVSATMGEVVGGTFATGLDPAFRAEMSDLGAFPIWVGAGAKSVANAVFAVDIDGNGYFSGDILNTAGDVLVSNNGLTPLGALIWVGGDRYAPQFAKTAAFNNVEDGIATFDLMLGSYVANDYGTGYDAFRVVNHKSDFWFDVTVGGDQGWTAVSVWYRYDGGTWKTMPIGPAAHPTYVVFDGNWHRSLGFSFQFTTQPVWNTVEFKVHLNDKAQSASATVEVRNFVGASSKADNSVSGMTGVAKQADRHEYTLEDLPDGGGRYAADEEGANHTESHNSKGATVHNDPTEKVTNRAPSWYRTNYPQAMAVEYKDRAAVAIPSQNASGTTIVLETRVPVDGPIMQAGYTDLGYYVRTGKADDTGWNTWSSTSADTLTIQGFDNTALTDGAQLGNKATWIQLRDKPTTLSEFGLSELVEPPLPDIESDEQILIGQSDGSKNWVDRLQKAYANITIPVIAADQDIIWTEEADFGDTVVIPNPGMAVSLNVLAFLNCDTTSLTYVLPNLSVDGGATWTRIGQGYSSNQNASSIVQAAGTWSGTPTGDVHIKVRAQSAASVNVQGGGHSYISVNMTPYSGVEWYVSTAPLQVTIVVYGDPPAIRGACSKYADNGTTCTASAQVPIRASGGSGGYSYSNAITSGPGAITSGASTATPIVSDTATTANPYAQTTTGIHCTVTDAGNQSLTSDTASVILRFYRLYHPISVSVADGECGCTTVYQGETCTASGSLTASLSGGSNPTPSWAATGGAGAITSGASSTTVHVADTEQSVITTSGNFTCTGSDGINPGDSDAGTMTFTFSSVKGYPP